MTSRVVLKAVEITSRFYPGYSVGNLKVDSRRHEVSHPRHFVWALMVANTTLSLSIIGRMTGGYHHTTVLYGSRKCYAEYGKDYFKQFYSEMEGLQYGSGSQRSLGES
jgi:chromosomal replication initiation ATPase DnaA